MQGVPVYTLCVVTHVGRRIHAANSNRQQGWSLRAPPVLLATHAASCSTLTVLLRHPAAFLMLDCSVLCPYPPPLRQRP